MEIIKRRVRTSDKGFEYDYTKQKNLFNIDALYRRLSQSHFYKARGKKQELETLMMYWWLHDMDGDTGHRKEYLATTYPEVFA
ncbi:hypothetical protein bcgnr5385_40820 [Bacillus cereus]